MTKLIHALMLVAIVLSAKSVLAQHTYYISKSLGNDTNTSTQAQSKSTPWQHVPGMAGATGTAGSYSPVAGDEFILYGGDTWGTSDLPLTMTSNGSGSCVTTPNSSCIYVGVDQTWYNSGVCGSSWCRPIFSQQNTVESSWYAMAYIYGKYITIDNVEFTGMLTSGGNTSRMVAAGNGGGPDVVEHCYFHGWNHSATGDADNSLVVGAGPGGIVHDNVIDGGDTLSATAVSGNPCGDPSGICQGMNTGVYGASLIYNNIIANVTSGIATTADSIHDNYIGPIWLGYTGGHRNGIQIAGTNSASFLTAYNNVMTSLQNNGMGGLWLEQGGGNSGIAAYVFNNVLFNGPTYGLGEGMQFCQLGGACGPFYAFNNTMQSPFNLSSGVTASLYAYNNHCIGYSSCINNEGTWTVTETTDLPQSLATANSQGYKSTSTYAFQPTNSAGRTVGQGTNEQSLCSTLNTLDSAAGTACLNATGYACAYNTSNHTVSCPSLLPETARSSSWDVGSYQFSSSLAAQPQAPTNLQATVQ